MLQPRIAADTVVVAAADQVSAGLDDEAVVLNLRSGSYHGLNEVGARVWQLLAEPRSVSSVADAIVSEYDVDRTRCQADILVLLEELLDQGLIEVRA
jgi:hypothetical protein